VLDAFDIGLIVETLTKMKAGKQVEVSIGLVYTIRAGSAASLFSIYIVSSTPCDGEPTMSTQYINYNTK